MRKNIFFFCVFVCSNTPFAGPKKIDPQNNQNKKDNFSNTSHLPLSPNSAFSAFHNSIENPLNKKRERSPDHNKTANEENPLLLRKIFVPQQTSSTELHAGVCSHTKTNPMVEIVFQNPLSWVTNDEYENINL